MIQAISATASRRNPRATPMPAEMMIPTMIS